MGLLKRAKYYGVDLPTKDEKEFAEEISLAALNKELSAAKAKNPGLAVMISIAIVS